MRELNPVFRSISRSRNKVPKIIPDQQKDSMCFGNGRAPAGLVWTPIGPFIPGKNKSPGRIHGKTAFLKICDSVLLLFEVTISYVEYDNGIIASIREELAGAGRAIGLRASCPVIP